MDIRYRVSDKVDRLVRGFITETNNGQFRKGMLMEFVEESLLKNIAAKKGILKQEIAESTHTQMAAIAKADTKRERTADNEFLMLKGKIVNYFVENFDSVPVVLPEKEIRLAIMAAIGRTDRRTITAKLDMLIAKGLFSRSPSNKGLIRIQNLFNHEASSSQSQLQSPQLQEQQEQEPGQERQSISTTEDQMIHAEIDTVLAKYGDLR